MNDRWYFEGGGLATHHHTPGVGWGYLAKDSAWVRRMEAELNDNYRGRQGVKYRIEGEWLTTRRIAGDARNTLRLGRKAVQSRLDRLRKRGYWPEVRGAGDLESFGPPNVRISWDFFQTQEPQEFQLELLPIHHEAKVGSRVRIVSRNRSREQDSATA